MGTREGTKTIEAVMKTLRIITVLSEEGAMGTTRLSQRLNLSKSTVHHHLNTLCTRGFVIKEGSEYRLSLRFLEFGERVRTDSVIYNDSQSEVRSLAEDTNLPTHLLAEERGVGVVVMTENGRGGVPSHYRVGEHVCLHALASGKAILANLSEQRITELLKQQKLTNRTAETADRVDDLMTELARVRERGYAVERSNEAENQWSIAAPVLQGDVVFGSVGVTCFDDKQDESNAEETLAEKVTRTADIIGIKMGYSR